MNVYKFISKIINFGNKYFRSVRRLFKLPIIKKIINVFPLPEIDDLPNDICEFLQFDKFKFLKSLKDRIYKGIYNGYKEQYDKWLKSSNYYFYDLCRWHLDGKHSFLFSNYFTMPKGFNILDFGSGIGTRSLIYSKKNKMTLVEINKKLLAFSEWRFKKYHRTASFYSSIPEKGSYDMVLLVDVIGHLTEPIKVISQIASSLKKNGILYVTLDNFKDSSSQGIHRNKEVNFYDLFKENGLVKLTPNHFKKVL